MRRLVWIAAALLIMVGIMGYALFSMRHIKQVNQQRHEREAGNDIAVQIIATTETTSIWDRLRPTETTGDGTGTSDASGTADPDTSMPPDSTDTTESPESADPMQPAESNGFAEPDVPTEQTTLMTVIVYQ